MYETRIVDMFDSHDIATLDGRGESSTQKRKHGPTEMKKITRARSEGQRLVIEYIELGQPIGQNATKPKSFIGTTVDNNICLALKFLPNEYSFIDQEHWNEFVASQLKEDFENKSEEGKEKRKQHKYNHRTFRKGYANLMEKLDELVATQKTTINLRNEDILTRVLGGELKEESSMGSKGKSSIEGAENLNEFEDLSNDLESLKNVEDVVGLNEEIKVNIAKDEELLEGVMLEKMKVETPCN
ncbi:uncharacterized protein E5676_scaffold571G00480 [Cucumis melo var. makuwa]|uniref:Uncharacterized protein n=1 Tax=Cucumis melo var. makuwa TaxID=1194695 RepID=A0A5A7V7Y1_CUCMM|nr:uncharacterized protein E6C27_scaffold89G00880 [Cucumis melo var. makuwa]TYK15405.1 uncharacterized protein E5676_scaffold571G00480 [Cucumis melo var. makuwa]